MEKTNTKFIKGDFSMKKLLVIAAAVLLLVPMGVFAQGAQETAVDQKIEARLASAEGAADTDFMTVWAEKFADFMREETDGMFDITVYPYGTVGDTRDIVELVQYGVMEFVFTDYGWLSSFVSQVNALALHYVWPKDNIAEVLEHVVRNGEFFPMMDEKFRQNDLVPLGIYFEGWQWLTSKTPVDGPEDLVGLKTRIMPSDMLSRNYRAYGIDPTPLAYGEIYSGLQTGLIDAQSQPMFANYTMGFYEVTDYFVQLWAEPFLGIPVVNLAFYESLSDEHRDLIHEFWDQAIVDSAEWIMDVNEDMRAQIEANRPSIRFSEFTDDQQAQLRDQIVNNVYPVFPQIGGPDSAAMLEALQQDIEEAMAALGM